MIDENVNQPCTSGGIPEQIKEVLKCRENICGQLEQLSADTPEQFLEKIGKLKNDYAAAPVPPPEYAELLDKRFHQAEMNAMQQIPRLEERQKLRGELAGKLQKLLAIGDLLIAADVEGFENSCKKVFGEIPADFAEQLAPLHQHLEAEAAAAAADNETGEKLLAELNELADAGDISLLRERKNGIDSRFKELKKCSPALRSRFQEASHKASQKLSRFFETLDFARWESYTLKLDLLRELDELVNAAAPDWSKCSKKLNEIRERWKTLGAVPKSKNEEINPRYLELTRRLQHKIDEFFSRRRQECREAAAVKETLIAEAEKLSTSTEWNVSSAAFRELQTKWKAAPHAGSQDTALYQRFRGFADIFFNARAAYFAEKDKKNQVVAEKKNALIAEAEALTDADFRRARQLREDFRAAGFAGRNEPELLKRFNAALDAFFSRRREEFAAKEQKSRELVGEMTSLLDKPTENLSRFRAIKEELAALNCKETASDVRKAEAAFEQALNSVRASETHVKGDLLRGIARDLAASLGKLDAGENFEFSAPEGVEMFPKLSAAAKLIGDAARGDLHAREKLNRRISAAREEHDRICSALEKITGTGNRSGKADSLAAELEAAIYGNFAGGEEKSASAEDPGRLAAEYLNAGLLPAAELEASFARFDSAWEKL